jgi:hypothetical protein
VAQMAKKYGDNCLRCVRWLLATRCVIIMLILSLLFSGVDLVNDVALIHDETKLCKRIFERIRRKISTIRTVFWFSSTLVGVYSSRLYWYHAKLMTRWEIDKITGLTDEAEGAWLSNEITCENDSGFRKNNNSSRVSYFKWVSQLDCRF